MNIRTNSLAAGIRKWYAGRNSDKGKEEAREAIFWWSKKVAHIVIVALTTLVLSGFAVAFGSILLSELYGPQVAGIGIAVITLISMFMFVVYFAAYWIDQPTILDNDELFDMLDELIQDENKKNDAKLDEIQNNIDYLTNLLEHPDGDDNH